MEWLVAAAAGGLTILVIAVGALLALVLLVAIVLLWLRSRSRRVDPEARREMLQNAGYTEAGPGPTGSVLTVDFELDGNRFTAINGGPQFTFDEAVSFLIECEDQAEIDRYWEALLADGGEASQCGWLKDRFGLSWQVVPKGMDELFADPDTARADRAMAAMLTMSKIDIAALEAAADGA